MNNEDYEDKGNDKSGEIDVPLFPIHLLGKIVSGVIGEMDGPVDTCYKGDYGCEFDKQPVFKASPKSPYEQ